MIAYKNHQQTEDGMNESKSFFSRMKKIFRFHKRKKKIDRNMVNKIERTYTYDDNFSNSNNSIQRSINSNNSKNSNNSIDLIRNNDNNYEIVLPYQRFLSRN